MRTDLEHPIAVYYDESGMRQEIRGEDLNENVGAAYEKAEKQAEMGRLLDFTETVELSVKPKTETNRAHFFSKSGARRRMFIDGGERNALHDGHVANIHRKLNARTKWRWEIGEMDLSGYEWRVEVVRVLSPNVAARHDLFGHPAVLHSTPKRPSVAIEVINEHYPDRPIFSALMCLSEQLPVVVFFDVVSRGNLFFKIGDDGILRPRFTMHGGKVWDYDKQTGIATSRELKRRMESIRNPKD